MPFLLSPSALLALLGFALPLALRDGLFLAHAFARSGVGGADWLAVAALAHRLPRDALLLLGTGMARLKRSRSKNWYENLKDYANALVGGWTPSLDPNISEVKSKTNIWSGAEAMNEGAKKSCFLLRQNIEQYTLSILLIFTKHQKIY